MPRIISDFYFINELFLCIFNVVTYFFPVKHFKDLELPFSHLIESSVS